MMRLVHQVMSLFFSFFASISETYKLHVSPPPPADIELQHVTTTPQSNAAQVHHAPLDHPAINQQLELIAPLDLDRLQNQQWDDLVMSICFMSSIQIATSASQPQIPALLYAFSLAISVAFSALCITKTMSDKFPRTSQWLRKMAVFIVAAAFYLVAAMSLPMYLKWVVAAVSAISFLAILLSHFL